MAALCRPDNIVWIDGSKEQKEALEKEALGTGEIIDLTDQDIGLVGRRDGRER